MSEELENTPQEEYVDLAQQAIINNAPISEEERAAIQPQEPVEAAPVEEVVDETPIKPEPAKEDNLSDADINLRTMRELREQEREERKRIERERDELMELLKNSVKPKASPKEEEEELRLNDDDLIEARHLKKYNKQTQREIAKLREEQEEARKQAAEDKARYEQQQEEARLLAQYPDMNEVVSGKNIKALSEAYPELAKTIASSSNFKDKAVAAYTAIKNMGIHSTKSYDTEKEVVKTNTKKPRPLTSMNNSQGSGSLAQANAFAKGLTPEAKKQTWQKMLEIRKRG